MNPQRNDPPAPRKRSGARFGIGCLALIAVLALFFMIVLLADNREPNKGLAVAVFGVPAILGGIGSYLWLRAMKRKELQEENDRHEKIVLRMAASAGGRATLAQVAQETPLSSEEAERAIEHLGRKGLVQYDLLDDGTVIYRFGGLMGE